MKYFILLPLFFVPLNAELYSQWTRLYTGLNTSLNTISAVDNDVVWAGGMNGKIVKTINGGLNWKLVSATGLSSNLLILNIFAVDSSVAFISGLNPNGVLFKTSNGGYNWIQVFKQPGGFINGVWMLSQNLGFIAGDPINERWSLWKTVNGGTDWDSTGLYLHAPIIETGVSNSLFVLDSNIWFGTQMHKMYYSSNFGNSWISRITPSGNIYSIWFNSPTRGVSGTQPDVMNTTNGGVTWSVTPKVGFFAVHVTGLENNYWYSVWNEIHRSTNYGQSYFPEFTLDSGFFYAVTASRQGTKVWASSSNGRVYLNENTSSILQNSIPASYYLSQNYPNPFNPSTKIRFDIPNSSFVKLTVYDILGREVSNLVNTKLNAGTYEYTFEADSFNSGVYFYKLETDGFVETKKMLLVK